MVVPAGEHIRLDEEPERQDIMNFRSKLVAITGSALILASSITMGAAEEAHTDTANASVSITTNASNVLTVDITNGRFDSKRYSFDDQTSSGSLTVTVTDLRGTAAGWKVNLSAKNFTTGGTSAKTFGIGNLKLTPGAVASETNSFSRPSEIEVGAGFQVAGAETQILRAPAGEGDGEFSSVLAGSLNVPGGTLVGDYTSEVKVSIDAAP